MTTVILSLGTCLTQCKTNCCKYYNLDIHHFFKDQWWNWRQDHPCKNRILRLFSQTLPLVLFTDRLSTAPNSKRPSMLIATHWSLNRKSVIASDSNVFNAFYPTLHQDGGVTDPYANGNIIIISNSNSSSNNNF